MADQGQNDDRNPRRDGWLLILYGLLLLAAFVMAARGLISFLNDPHDPTLLGLGVLSVILVCGLYGIVTVLSRGGGPAGRSPANNDRLVQVLESINERIMVSDAAKRIAYREQDREALRKAIREDIDKGDFEAALVMVNQMSQVYGYRLEAEQFRSEIMAARAADLQHRITDAIADLDKLIDRRDWDSAVAYTQKLQRLYPDQPQVRDLMRHVTEARDRHKKELEREFLEAANRDDVDRAMELMKTLDRYLSSAEAERFREVARGVVTKARQNLGVQFKLAVHDKEWTQALRIGEQVIREFPNSKMADEVRGMLDIMRERAAGEQAARPREMA
jgi:tetratricopeptide (TPR) repeat protein